MKSKAERPLHLCAHCTHASFGSTEMGEELSFSAALRADPQRDETVLKCPYHKDISADFSCRRFCFDPLKYRPHTVPSPVLLDEEAVLLD